MLQWGQGTRELYMLPLPQYLAVRRSHEELASESNFYKREEKHQLLPITCLSQSKSNTLFLLDVTHQQLRVMLDRESQNDDATVQWSTDGNSFIIIDQAQFEEVGIIPDDVLMVSINLMCADMTNPS
mmetsp:Transcript_15442/g.23779  ORF Transcript_15442/g.23779 Transcript_15442/m.23779 type:complete len:127 (-) Transcript_15442:1534-1914(-)